MGWQSMQSQMPFCTQVFKRTCWVYHPLRSFASRMAGESMTAQEKFSATVDAVVGKSPSLYLQKELAEQQCQQALPLAKHATCMFCLLVASCDDIGGSPCFRVVTQDSQGFRTVTALQCCTAMLL